MSRKGKGIGFLVTSTGLFPIWLWANPDFRPGHTAPIVYSMAAGALLVGCVFLLLTRLRLRVPSLAFAFAVPALGVIGFAITNSALEPFYGYLTDVESNLYTGLLWLYIGLLPATCAASIAHTLLLRWVGRLLCLSTVTG